MINKIIAIFVLIVILAAALFMPDEAGESFSREPYLIVLDADGNVIHQEYRSAEDYFRE